MIGRNASAPPDDLDAEGIDALAEALVAGSEPIELLWIWDEFELLLDAIPTAILDGNGVYQCAHAVATRLYPRLQAERRAQAEDDAAQAAEDRWA